MKAVIAVSALLAGAVLFLPVDHAGAQQTSGEIPFMVHAAQGGVAEVELGQLATQRAASPAVKGFGQRMVTDHGAANAELMQLGQSKGVSLPTTPDPKDQALLDQLSTMSGTQFDRTYMQAMVSDHTQDVSDFEREARTGTDPAVRAWAEKTLPTLRQHLQMAREIQGGVVQAPAGLAAASPGTAVVTSAWCGGTYMPGQGTNFGSCQR